MSRDGGIGRRTGLKIPRWQQRGGSIPPPGTNKINDLRKSKSFFFPYIRNSIYFMNLNTVDI